MSRPSSECSASIASLWESMPGFVWVRTKSLAAQLFAAGHQRARFAMNLTCGSKLVGFGVEELRGAARRGAILIVSRFSAKIAATSWLLSESSLLVGSGSMRRLIGRRNLRWFGQIIVRTKCHTKICSRH